MNVASLLADAPTPTPRDRDTHPQERPHQPQERLHHDTPQPSVTSYDRHFPQSAPPSVHHDHHRPPPSSSSSLTAIPGFSSASTPSSSGPQSSTTQRSPPLPPPYGSTGASCESRERGRISPSNMTMSNTVAPGPRYGGPSNGNAASSEPVQQPPSSLSYSTPTSMYSTGNAANHPSGTSREPPPSPSYGTYSSSHHHHPHHRPHSAAQHEAYGAPPAPSTLSSRSDRENHHDMRNYGMTSSSGNNSITNMAINGGNLANHPGSSTPNPSISPSSAPGTNTSRLHHHHHHHHYTDPARRDVSPTRHKSERATAVVPDRDPYPSSLSHPHSSGAHSHRTASPTHIPPHSSVAGANTAMSASVTQAAPPPPRGSTLPL